MNTCNINMPISFCHYFLLLTAAPHTVFPQPGCFRSFAEEVGSEEREREAENGGGMHNRDADTLDN